MIPIRLLRWYYIFSRYLIIFKFTKQLSCFSASWFLFTIFDFSIKFTIQNVVFNSYKTTFGLNQELVVTLYDCEVLFTIEQISALWVSFEQTCNLFPRRKLLIDNFGQIAVDGICGNRNVILGALILRGLIDWLWWKRIWFL